MYEDIKVLLTIKLEGGTLIRESEKIHQGGKKNQNRFTHRNLISKPCYIRCKLSEECYKHMMSNLCPTWGRKYNWGRITPKQRLELHLNRICEDYNGIEFTYELLE